MLMMSAGAGLAWVQTQAGLLDRHRFDSAVVAERREGGTRVLARWKSPPW
jgi:hypothetical protein